MKKIPKIERLIFGGTRGVFSMALEHLCSLPTGSKPFIQSKIEQSKHKQKYQDLTIRVLLLFVFRLFTPSPLCPLPSVLSLFSKKRKGNQERKTETKTPGNNVFTRKIQIQDQYNQNSTCLCFRPFGWACIKQ